MVGREKFDVGEFRFERVEESGFARLGAGGADRVAQKDDVPFSAEQLPEMFAGQLAAFVVVSGDETDVLVRLKPGVKDHHGDFGLDGVFDGFYERL